MESSSTSSSLQEEGRAAQRSFRLPGLQTSSTADDQRSLSVSIDESSILPSLSGLDTNTMSPPITPARRVAVEMSLPVMEFPPTPRTSIDERPDISAALSTPKTQSLAMTEILAYSGSYKLGQHLGSGAWSNVYLAEELSSGPAPKSGRSLTPPPSPGITALNRRPKLLAIKKAQHQRAKAVIAREARMLSFIFSDPESSSHVIGFHGFDAEAQGIVLSFAPLTLKRFSEQRLALAKQNISTSTMHEPVIGTTTWKHFARSLISGLAWLHAREVAHGDVKTDNILLMHVGLASTVDASIESGDGSAYQPLLCDFSTAHMVTGDDSNRDDADDAITPSYASPELLASFRFTTNKLVTPVDWQKADVWSMGVCLVVAAVGVEPYAAQHSSMMKLHYAKLGEILGSVRNDSGQATRIMKGSLAARTAALALAKTAEARVSAAEWLERLDF